ncbi:unnamed protein product [Prorocentrum cordatum]|uniref:Prolyl 4-hydroxylase alpha subunit domain-containing protein n=1 Tax=Prorocentrum cordatum TaxID=2364126 RepID=A0ABN9SVK6_9DINO|nr:unnamed protein product [Polarella glacialis]
MISPARAAGRGAAWTRWLVAAPPLLPGAASPRPGSGARAAGRRPCGSQSAFLGITGDKERSRLPKSLRTSTARASGTPGDRLPRDVRGSLSDASRVRFVGWLGHGVTKGKAAIVQLFTAEEADAIIGCMDTDGQRAGVMSAAKTAQLYVGRVNTSRHLIADQRLADRLFRRFQKCTVEEEDPDGAAPVPFLSLMRFGEQVVAVNERIRLVTTGSGGEHQKHADINGGEPSEDGRRVSRLTFQCYFNPEAYEGGQFQLHPQGGAGPVDVPTRKGCAVVFVRTPS